ncbi:MAG: polyribonucleotide nucleotidyltransferase [Desulfobacterota bacterium]|nr:polyribonucleotide nucleotidyltransferase [Thermodesulfobacteriota bacterium]MDW8001923.1 polyribonucleotide nucleotidyltransferase [Deltaproteobacteria bacterium]
MQKRTITIEFANRPLSITVGEMAKQADGSVLVQYADTAVLVTAVAERKETDLDFLPLTVNYQEMSYAAGRFPGGFFKREGRPSDREILISRLIDRPLRPLFPKGFNREVQIIATVLSADQENDPAILGIIGASCALTLSEIPFEGPIAGVKIGRKNGSFIINPTTSEMEESDMEIVVAGTKDAIIMVEGGAKFVKGEDLIDAVHFGHKSMLPLIECQERLKEELGIKKWIFVEPEIRKELKEEVKEKIKDDINEALAIPEKKKRRERLKEIKESLSKLYPDVSVKDLGKIFDDVLRELMREKLLTTGLRIDGRKPNEIRAVEAKVGIFPRTHGSALFTRGETQALAITTFGTSEDEQKVESLLEGEVFKAFMVHYNFPPFSVGEVAPLRAPTRREIGHGYLAERALSPILPPKDEFPYTIRIVSEILESNGSSSMATVCSGCLSLMDAGVPIKEPVAGIAMGLVKEGDREIILWDILGDEDHLGDMDFKIAGSKRGVTAIQMDLKIKGITKDTMLRVVKEAQEGIEKILSIMTQVMPKPREKLSPYAPRILTVKINPEKIRDIIGPGGKVIKSIIDQTGVKIDIEDSGMIKVASHNEASALRAIELIKEAAREVELGAIYQGKVKRIVDSGVIVEIWPGSDGFVHISQLADGYIRRIQDIVKEGDTIPVKVIEIDQFGRIKLSRKAALRERK